MRDKSIIMADSSDIYHDGRILKEAKALSEIGYKITIYGFRNFNFKKPSYAFTIKTLPFISRKYRKLRDMNIIINIIIINFILIFKKASYYHSHNTMFLPGLYFASKLWGGTLIYDSHEVQWEANSLSKKLEELFIHKAKCIINVSEGRAKHQAQRFNINPNKIIVISNYPEIPTQLPVIEKKQNTSLSFIYSGGFDLGTNRLDKFVEALSNFDDYTFTLMAFGYGTSEQQLQKLIKNYNLQDKIKFVPLVSPDKVVETIAKYDVAVNLSYNPKQKISIEYHGINKMYEYLMAGLPILCSNLASFVSEFQENSVGKAVDPVNIQSISEGINYFITNKNNMDSIKNKARELALTKFNWNTQKVKLISLYKNL